MAKSFKLILQSGPTAGAEYALEKEELYLGRDVNNDITINDPEVSRRHARLIRQGDAYLYEDLGSTNGSFILGQRVSSPILLQPGTTITIGERVVINYIADVFDPSATVAAPRQNFAPRTTAEVPPPVSIAHIPPATPQAISPAPPAYTPLDQAVATPPPPIAPVSAPKKKSSRTVMILLIILGVILVFCVIPWIIVEVTNSYCSLFPGIFNAIQAGVCP